MNALGRLGANGERSSDRAGIRVVSGRALSLGSRSATRIFIAAFNEKFGGEPDEDEAIPFATCEGMEEAIRATGSTDNDVLRDWLASRTAGSPSRRSPATFHWDERGLPEGKPFLDHPVAGSGPQVRLPGGPVPRDGTASLEKLPGRRDRLPADHGARPCRAPSLVQAPLGVSLALLEIQGLSKAFGGIGAVEGCSLRSRKVRSRP